MICYLAGPIDYSEDNGITWKSKIKKWCNEDSMPIAFFDPNAYSFNKLNDRVANYIHDVNMFALNNCDLVLARLMKDTVSIGTPIELYHAINIKKPIILITDMFDSVYMKYISSNCNTLHTVESIKTAYNLLCETMINKLDIYDFKYETPEELRNLNVKEVTDYEQN